MTILTTAADAAVFLFVVTCRSMRMKASGPRKRLFLSWIISIDCLVLPGRRTAHLKSNTVRSSGLARDESQVTTQ